jgi:hypothetical protein
LQKRHSAPPAQQSGGKQYAHHRGMLREDVSGRFDYLFETLEVDETAGEGHEARPKHPRSPTTTAGGHAE